MAHLHPIYRALEEFKAKYGYDLMSPAPAPSEVKLELCAEASHEIDRDFDCLINNSEAS